MRDAAPIVARVTPPAMSGVGIIRVSGAEALHLSRPLCVDLPEEVEPRRAYFTSIGAPDIVDQGLFLYFRGPHSFTGEDVVEFHLHGSPVGLQMLLAQLLGRGARLAGPGEFSRRAFINGRIDLAKAEAIADLIAAKSESAVKAAAAQLKGNVSQAIGELTRMLLDLQVDLEGSLNFPEEAEGSDAGIEERLSELLERLQQATAQAQRGVLLRRGGKVVLFGPSNAGKSSLFNALTGEPRALVDEEPGTTRDSLHAELNLKGLPVTLVDTAGLRDHPTRIEALGIERTRQSIEGADLVLVVVPAAATAEERAPWCGQAGKALQLRIASKADLSSPSQRDSMDVSWLKVSATTGEGVDFLKDKIADQLWDQGAPEAVVFSSERHADALKRASQALTRASGAFVRSTTEVVAGEVSLAVEALSEITGGTNSESLLDGIFSKFCIGK